MIKETTTYHEQANNGKKWCYDCIHYRDYHRWGEFSCDVYGWLGVGQTAMHPDTSADNCKDYNHPSDKPLWFES